MNEELNDQVTSFERIALEYKFKNDGVYHLRFSRSLSLGFISFFMMILTIIILTEGDSYFANSWEFCLLVALISALISMSYYFISSYPKNKDDLIDDLLSEYNPLDKEGFRQLQEKTKNNNGLGFEDMCEWIGREREYINNIRPKEEPPNFTKKNV